jgi:hypothetical protein
MLLRPQTGFRFLDQYWSGPRMLPHRLQKIPRHPQQMIRAFRATASELIQMALAEQEQ